MAEGRDASTGSRRARTTAWIAGAVLVSAVVGVGAWALWGAGPTEAAPTPSASPSETSSPALSETAEALVFPAPLPAGELFLESSQLTQEIWEQIGEGWTLTYWEPSRARHGEDAVGDDDPNMAAFYVQSPTGDRFEVGHFPVSGDHYRGEIQSWVPGSFKAIISEASPNSGDSWSEWIDLRDGTTEPVQGIGDALFEGTNVDGDMVFFSLEGTTIVGPDGVLKQTFDSDHYDVSPDGTVITGAATSDAGDVEGISAISATTGEALWSFDIGEINDGDPSRCTVDGWAGPSEPAVICQASFGDDQSATIYEVGPNGARDIYQDGGTDWHLVNLAADGVVATGGPPDSDGVWTTYYIDRSPIAEWPAQDGHAEWPGIRTVGGVEYALSLTGSDSYPQYMNARVVSTGETFAVTPRLTDDPDWWYPTQAATYLVGGTGAFS